ncbi:MAG: hypothetical protein OHK0013_33710 [Sandaracinaceae bacterium]
MLLANAFSTWAMVGAIWIVQIVHYPLFARVGEAGWTSYERAHQSLITLVVGPLMLVEALTSLGLALSPPTLVRPLEAWAGLALVAVAWLVTATVSVPLHGQLSAGFDGDAHRALVATNWIRTLAWSAHGALCALWLARAVLR